MKKLPLRPYHGTVWICETKDELHRAYKKLCRVPYPYTDGDTGGRYVMVEGQTLGDRVWLVWATEFHSLAHELCHVLLRTFQTIGHDPTEGDGEPFCYMLSALLQEAKP